MQLSVKNTRHICRSFAYQMFTLLFLGLLNVSATAKPKDAFPDKTTSMAELQTKCQAGDLNYCGRIAVNFLNGNLVTKDEVKGFNLLKSYCDQSNMGSCSSIGYAYYNGKGTRKDIQKGALHTTKACNGNNALACSNLGFYYSNGKGFEKNESKAYEFYTKACDLNLGKGCINQARYLYLGINGEKDIAQAERLHTKACEDGQTCRWAGAFYKSQKLPEKALSYFKKGCEEFNSGKSCAEMSYIYSGEKRYALGLENHDKGCDLGYIHSCGVIGYYYKEGWGVDINYSRALKLLVPACENETPSLWSCEQAGDVYVNADKYYSYAEYGDIKDTSGTLRTMSADRAIVSDYQKAAYFYNLACEGARKIGCNSLGATYDSGGTNLQVNQQLATKAYLKLCELEGACFNAAERLLEGKGIPKNTEKAITLFEQKCKNKHPSHCYELGVIYQIGEHREKNIEIAQRYYEISCNQFKRPYLAVACAALADIYNNKNKFAKADKVLKTLCEGEGKGTSCQSTVYYQHQHLCKLGQEQSCDSKYVGDLMDAAKAAQKKTLNKGSAAPVAPKPKYTPPTQSASIPKPLVLKSDKGCDGLSAPACFKLAKDYLKVGGNVSKDSRKARDMFVKLCDSDYANACMFAGQTYISSDYKLKGSYNKSKARAYYIKACDLDNAEGCTSAASTYPPSDVYDVDKLPLYKRACKMGNKGGCNGVARLTNTGDYAPK